MAYGVPVTFHKKAGKGALSFEVRDNQTFGLANTRFEIIPAQLLSAKPFANLEDS